ncbi:putative cell wall-binding protein [Kineosphaera limosa]|uniref:Uncharacterized protein n=1 Tax=Kineosphaera limosa NBRC 100340 TaxID=1184609 RepID=K6WQP1_9MICO|nr:cell wall-binding repeat-containing protein [Kineosphaera limosa]NYE01930.1 putative cell wall-binding protein [Kineosphaera limosa]GAB96156.1 hypothetical protein KILIM_032_00420 [Kineosphaera limosa NBRC 100340]
MPVSSTRRLTTATATIALAAAGLVAPAMSANAAPAITLNPTAPVAGSAFTASFTGLTANNTYRLALTGTTAGDKADRAESNTCRGAAPVSATTLSCTLTEAAGGAYELKLLDGNDNTVLAQAVTVRSIVSIPQAAQPSATDGAGTANDAITLTRVPNVTWTIDGGAAVTFPEGVNTQEVRVTPGDPSTDYRVTATAADGHVFEGGSTTWSQTFRLTSAATVPALLPTPTAPVVIDEPGKTNDAVRLTRVENVTWFVNGTEVPWTDNATVKTVPVTHGEGGRVTVTARAAAGRAFPGLHPAYDFVYTYTDERGEPTSTRVAGNGRVETAIEASKKYFPQRTETVYVANALNFPDALSAGPAAARQESPLLLTLPNQASSAVLDEVRRLAPQSIRIVGGTTVVSPEVERQLQQIAPVTRLQGQNRYATAAAVSGTWAKSGTVYVALGLNFPDALSAGSGAAKENAPLLLSDGNGLSGETVAALQSLEPANVKLVGGADVLRASVERQIRDVRPSATITRYAGADRFATSAAVIENVTGRPGDQTTAFLATGLNFPDALSGVPAAHKAKAPLALTLPQCLPASVKTQLDKLPLTAVTRLGGSSVVGDYPLSRGC